jgi:rare lipoprotein A (peptidoglycan hydrolase)
MTAPVTALPRALCVLALAVSITGTPRPAVAAIPSPSAREPSSAREAVSLQSRIEDERETLTALDGRIEAMDRQLFAQKTLWSDARARLRGARFRYRLRIVSLYKHGGLGPIEMLVASSSMRDLLRRSAMAERMARSDRNAVVAARKAEAEAAYTSAVLSDMKRQLRAMRAHRASGLAAMEEDLRRQRELLSQLDRVQRKTVTQEILRETTSRAVAREKWSRKSVPLKSPVWLAHATVSPYSRDYLVPSYQPMRYASAGAKRTAVCSWYGNQFHGRRTASGQIFNQNDFTCASRSLPFGTRLALSRGARHIIVVVNDRGPFIAGRDLDLSRAAARALGFSGVASVAAEKVVVTR